MGNVVIKSLPDTPEKVLKELEEGLKPCPFRGNLPSIEISGAEVRMGFRRLFPYVRCVTCTHCGISFHGCGDNPTQKLESAVWKWNTRSYPQIPQGGTINTSLTI